MSISDIRTKLVDRLKTITNLSCYKEVPDAIGKLPAAVIIVEAVDYDETFAEAKGLTLRVLLLIAEKDSARAWGELEDYLEVTGSKSIKAAVEGGNGGAAAVVDYARVSRAENIGLVSYRGSAWLGAEFVLEVAN